MQKLEPSHHFKNDRESIRALDHDTLVDMFLSLDTKFQQLAEYVRDIVNKKYGQNNERFESPGQLVLFPGAPVDTDTAPKSSPDGADTSRQSPKNKKPGHGRNPMPDDLPHVSIVAPPPPDAASPCSCCGADRVPDRHLLQNSRYQFVPASFYIEDLYSVVYVCSSGLNCEQSIARVHEAVPQSIAAPGLMAQVAVARDFDHVPFNRQSTIYARSGVHLPRSTLSDFYAHLARILLPLYEFMHQILDRKSVV